MLSISESQRYGASKNNEHFSIHVRFNNITMGKCHVILKEIVSMHKEGS